MRFWDGRNDGGSISLGNKKIPPHFDPERSAWATLVPTLHGALALNSGSHSRSVPEKCLPPRQVVKCLRKAFRLRHDAESLTSSFSRPSSSMVFRSASSSLASLPNRDVRNTIISLRRTSAITSSRNSDSIIASCPPKRLVHQSSIASVLRTSHHRPLLIDAGAGGPTKPFAGASPPSRGTRHQ